MFTSVTPTCTSNFVTVVEIGICVQLLEIILQNMKFLDVYLVLSINNQGGSSDRSDTIHAMGCESGKSS